MNEQEEYLEDDSGAMLIDGFEEAIIGVCDTWDNGNCVRRIVYSGEKILQQLMNNDSMDEEEAEEYCSYNIEGAYVGPNTPVIVWPYDDQEP